MLAALFVGTVALAPSLGCRGIAKPEVRSPLLLQPTFGGDPDSVVFEIRPEPANAQGFRESAYLATYRHNGKIARFTIAMVSKTPAGDPPVAITSGEIRRVPQSDSTVLIAALARALQAKRVPVAQKHVARLKFDLVVLGERQSRATGDGGGFVSNPPGDWIVMKAVVGDDDGEFFLNLNPKEELGEFSIKDSDYGDAVVRELAKVL